MASGAAERDALGAMDWIAQFRGDPVFEDVADVVISSAVRAHPTEALALFTTLPPASQIDVARSLVGSWAWHDPVAARSWVVGLPRGPLRDSGLDGLLSTNAFRYRNDVVRPPDPQLLALFSADEARQEAVVDVVMRIAERDQTQARALLNQYVSDPVMLSRADQYMRRMAN